MLKTEEEFIDQFSAKMDEASALIRENRYDDGIRIGKQLLQDADVQGNDALCMFVCDLIVYAYGMKNREEDPLPGSSMYKEVHKYLKMLIASYDRSDPEQQAAFKEACKERFHHLRPMLSLMEDGKPLSAYNPEPKKEKKTGCFVATACYGSYSAPEVMILRRFRDRIMMKSIIGRAFVTAYYCVSPPIADFISKKQTLKSIVRVLLIKPIVFITAELNKGSK